MLYPTTKMKLNRRTFIQISAAAAIIPTLPAKPAIVSPKAKTIWLPVTYSRDHGDYFNCIADEVIEEIRIAEFIDPSRVQKHAPTYVSLSINDDLLPKAFILTLPKPPKQIPGVYWDHHVAKLNIYLKKGDRFNFFTRQPGTKADDRELQAIVKLRWS